MPDFQKHKMFSPRFQGLATIGVGDLVRDEVKRGTAVGEKLKVRNVI